ncbi:MAG: hypothetical protein ACI9EV_002318, partial [Urechidicola sp.]
SNKIGVKSGSMCSLYEQFAIIKIRQKLKT